MTADEIKKVIKDLYDAFYINSDPRYYGENPACDKYEDILIEEFSKMKDDEIESYIKDMSLKELEPIHFVMEQIEDDHPVVVKYLKKTGW